MSAGIETDMETLGAHRTGTQTDMTPGARLDTSGAIPTDFTAGQKGTGSMAGMLTRGGNLVGQQPWRAIALGLIIGILVGRRTRPTVDMMRDDYLEPAIGRAQGAMITGTLALGAMLRLLRRTMAWRTREAMFVARWYSKPLAKATRKTTRRLQRKLHVGRTSFLWR